MAVSDLLNTILGPLSKEQVAQGVPTIGPQNKTQTPVNTTDDIFSRAASGNIADDEISSLYDLLTGSNISYNYPSAPNLMGTISDLNALNTQRQQSQAPYQREMLDLARGIAGQQSSQSTVLDALTKYMAQQNQNYQPLLSQQAEATTAAQNAFAQALASPQLLNRFRTTEGAIAPQAISAAYESAQPKIQASQLATDTVNTLMGIPQQNIQRGLEAFNADLQAKQFLSQSLGQQVDLGNQDFEIASAIKQLYPELAQQTWSNEIATMGDTSTYGDAAVTKILASQPRDFFAAEGTDKLLTGSSLKDRLGQLKLEIANGNYDEATKQKMINALVTKPYAEALKEIKAEGLLLHNVDGALQTITPIINKLNKDGNYKNTVSITIPTDLANYLQNFAVDPKNPINFDLENWTDNNGTKTLKFDSIQSKEGYEKKELTKIYNALKSAQKTVVSNYLLNENITI